MAQRRAAVALRVGLFLLCAATSLRSEPLSPVHHQRYSMGTLFDIVVYHASRADAERAVGKAMEEIVRLDQVMSHFKADSELSRLVRQARSGFVTVEPSLYEVIQESIAFSRRSDGIFDVTIAPLLRTWKEAQAEGRSPSAADISEARKCVGYEKIETAAPDRIRLRSDCVEIDLGGIGKGYAVDRALAVLKSAGIRDASINAGGSSIAAIGAPPGREGWPVRIGANRSGRNILLLRGRSISTSQQNRVPLAFEPGGTGEIIDPRTAAPTESRMTVSVVAPRATVSDALSTTLLLLSIEEGVKLLAQFADASAIWISAAGELKAACPKSQLRLLQSR